MDVYSDIIIGPDFPPLLRGPYYRSVEYKIHLRSKKDYIILPGSELKIETNVKIVNTNSARQYFFCVRNVDIPGCVVNGKLIGEKIVHPGFTGRIDLEIKNTSAQKNHINHGTNIGLLYLIPYTWIIPK